LRSAAFGLPRVVCPSRNDEAPTTSNASVQAVAIEQSGRLGETWGIPPIDGQTRSAHLNQPKLGTMVCALAEFRERFTSLVTDNNMAVRGEFGSGTGVPR